MTIMCLQIFKELENLNLYVSYQKAKISILWWISMTKGPGWKIGLDKRLDFFGTQQVFKKTNGLMT